jgi:hypothetical protein
MKSTYIHRYAPLFFYGTVVSAVSEQTMDVSARGGGSISFGAALFLGGRFGVRLSTIGFEASVSGTTSPDRVSMTYVARQPPDYVAREYSIESESKIPAPYGQQRTRAYSLDLIWRLGNRGGSSSTFREGFRS